ncbi:MAG: hypothetical protein IT159_04330 [Bryobacterales bacterium]|nr:hypothetical protein [Bryobacterales bacterium]
MERRAARVPADGPKLRFDQQRGKLIDADEAKAEIERRFRADSQALFDWPSRVAAEFAAEVGADEPTFRAVFEKHVRRFMKDRARWHDGEGGHGREDHAA